MKMQVRHYPSNLIFKWEAWLLSDGDYPLDMRHSTTRKGAEAACRRMVKSQRRKDERREAQKLARSSYTAYPVPGERS